MRIICSGHHKITSNEQLSSRSTIRVIRLSWNLASQNEQVKLQKNGKLFERISKLVLIITIPGDRFHFEKRRKSALIHVKILINKSILK